MINRLQRSARLTRYMLNVTIEDNTENRRFIALPNATKSTVVRQGLSVHDAFERSKLAMSSDASDRLAQGQLEEIRKLKEQSHAASLSHQKEIQRMQSLEDEAVQRAIVGERKQREIAESLCAQQAGEIRVLSGTLYDKVREECDKVRHEYQTRLEATEQRERETREALTSLVVRKSKSTTKGADGETTVLGLLNQLFPTADIEDCSGTPGMGDFNVILGDACMMVEVKNYKRNVAKAEVDKFLRDMQNNPGYTCGILASIDSGVSGWKDFGLASASGRPVVFLHNIGATPEKLVQAYSVFEMVHSVENLDLNKQSVLEAVGREVIAKQRRTKVLQGIAERHQAEIERWIHADAECSLETLKMITGGK